MNRAVFSGGVVKDLIRPGQEVGQQEDEGA